MKRIESLIKESAKAKVRTCICTGIMYIFTFLLYHTSLSLSLSSLMMYLLQLLFMIYFLDLIL